MHAFFSSPCVVQDDEPLDLKGSPQRLLRSQTSPSSVLEALQSPPGRTGLVSCLYLPWCAEASGLACIACLPHLPASCWFAFLLTSMLPSSTLPCPRLVCLPGLQLSIAESPRHRDGGMDGGDGWTSSLSPALGILNSAANAHQDVLGGLWGSSPGGSHHGADQLSGTDGAPRCRCRNCTNSSMPAHPLACCLLVLRWPLVR